MRVSASVQESPPKITLSWPNDGDAASYTLSRRRLDTGWQPLATLGGGETSYSDGNVSVGEPYEYQIVKRSTFKYTGYGYIRAGIRASLPDYRGKMILLVENSIGGALSAELNRLRGDLAGDGWVVVRRDVSMNNTPREVKAVIRSSYDSDPANVKGVFLLGHVPVPYSGNIFPDGHPNHQGAWPADLYYGEMDGPWTDQSVNATTAERQINWNTPGDGKFDQGKIPSEVDLIVGRVDFHNMTCFANKNPPRSELDLTRQYLNKNHAFRSGAIAVERRGIICDNFDDKGDDPIAGSAWRAFPAFFGPDKITEVPWDGLMPVIEQDSYLWAYGSGGGTYYYSVGVGSSDGFALKEAKVVFAMFMGSYFGDWNNESNFLRSALGSGTILTSSYSGFPHSLYFPMALGETIGICMRMSQNNGEGGLYPPWNQGAREVHVALMGDPTLRMHPVKPASNLAISSENDGARLSWGASPDGSIQGYHVYRSTSAEGPFDRITRSPIAGTSFTDAPPAGVYTYMVRAIKLEQSGAGTYLNPSQGIFQAATIAGGAGPQPPTSPVLQASAISPSQVRLSWADVANEAGYRVERRSGASAEWSEIAVLAANATSYGDDSLSPASEYFYRIRAFNEAGVSDYSNEARVATQAVPRPESSAAFIELDTSTGGDWPRRFGRAGGVIAGQASTLGAEIQAGMGSIQTHVWERSATEVRALVTAPFSADRIASAWFGEVMAIDLSVTSSAGMAIALYFLDWDRAGRSERVAITDRATGLELDAREISSFADGKFLVYEIQGNVRIRISKIAGPNAVFSGLFAGGPGPGPLGGAPLKLAAVLDAPGQVSIRVEGEPGQDFRIESSSDLRSWTEFTRSRLVNSWIEIPIPGAANLAALYLRAVN